MRGLIGSRVQVVQGHKWVYGCCLIFHFNSLFSDLFGQFKLKHYILARNEKQHYIMEPTVPNKEQLYNDFVKAFRTYKRRKREWQERMEVVLAAEEEEIRRKREVLYADYE